MANLITSFRILGSVALLLCSVFTPLFYVLYILAGITDMFDGTVARKTNKVSFKIQCNSCLCYCNICSNSRRSLN